MGEGKGVWGHGGKQRQVGVCVKCGGRQKVKSQKQVALGRCGVWGMPAAMSRHATVCLPCLPACPCLSSVLSCPPQDTR